MNQISKDQIADLYRAGWSAKQIAQKVGCTAGNVYRHLQTIGYRDEAGLSVNDLNLLETLVSKRKSVRQISDRFKAKSPYTVQKTAKQIYVRQLFS